MGVRGLWKILEPTAQPVQLESLRGKILAIDASIWIYHFVKAMRDPKGTVLAAAHIIGFFRRICKLLFYEIKPVFVFDGAPPILKKETTNKRNERRVNREQSARNTANKLLTIQLQRLQQKQKNDKEKESNNETTFEIVGDIPENAVFLEDLEGTSGPVETTVNTNDSSKPFVKQDQYHLPEIGSIAPIRGDDLRMLTQDELDKYAAQFTSQARSGFIDTSLVDFHSPEFDRLPIEMRYQLINMARMKSRLRMGFTADELNKMFPNEMEFSKFQINRVAQRNFFTQKLMNLVGLEEDLTRRISGEKDKEYLLKRTDQGWSLSLEGRQEKQNESSEDEFEEVDLEPNAIEESKESKDDNEKTIDTNEKEETIDLTKEENAKLDELFGFEALLTRQNIYEQIMEEAGVSKPDEVIKPIAFEDASSGDEENEENDDIKEKVPWFFDQGFKEMEINNHDDPNFVDINEINESEDEVEVVEHSDNEKNGNIEHTETKEPTEEPLFVEPVEPSPQGAEHEAIEASEENVEQYNLYEKTSEYSTDSIKETAPHTETEGETEGANPIETTSEQNVPIAKATPELAKADSPEKIIEKPSAEFIERAEEEARDAEEENENIAGMLVAEAEENERFARELAENSKKSWTDVDEREYQNQISLLRQQFAKNTRDADNISTEMIQECQELLQLFGIPYITAPAEAEAQCAELRNLRLVDGVVTDDGDTFLFDDNAVVYRNMFSQAKYVEFYSTKQIRQNLGLDRYKLIELAFLLGSDYTDGILGIGPVTGVEIIAEFGDLKTFSAWFNEAQRFPDTADVSTPLKKRLLKQFKSKLFLPEDFPREAVVDAYLNPAVNKDDTKFSWGTPDLDNIRKMLNITAGWNAEKVNAVILPVVQENKRRDLRQKTLASIDQSHINDYYASVVQNPAMGSKRTNKAVERLRKRSKNT